MRGLIRLRLTTRLLGAASLLVALAGAGCGGSHTTSTGAQPSSTLPLPDLIEHIKSGIVRIDVTGCGFKATGTGFLVGPREVLTVEHVVDSASMIRIERNGIKLGKGTVIGADGARDLALIRTQKPISGYQFKISTKAPRLGDSVAVIGYPLGLPLSVTKGTVSGLSRVIPIRRVKRRGLIQTDAAVNPGNSGGPLVLLPSGQIIGLVDLGSLKANGIAFAVSGKVAAALVDAWKVAPQPLPAATCRRPSPPLVTQSVASSSGSDLFQSPTGNIRCEYLNERGVACMTLNDGLGVLLRSFDRSYYLNQPYAFNPPAGRTLPYGATWSHSSFRCKSSTAGIECWSTLTGHGFFISRRTWKIY